MQHVSGIDHCVLLVRDLDAAERAMARLGFRPTPRGHHSAHMGTANATVVFRDGTYFETLGVVAEHRLQRGYPGRAGAARRHLRDRAQDRRRAGCCRGVRRRRPRAARGRGLRAPGRAAGRSPRRGLHCRPHARQHVPGSLDFRLPAAHAGGRLARGLSRPAERRGRAGRDRRGGGRPRRDRPDVWSVVRGTGQRGGGPGRGRDRHGHADASSPPRRSSSATA